MNYFFNKPNHCFLKIQKKFFVDKNSINGSCINFNKGKFNILDTLTFLFYAALIPKS